MSSLIDVYRRLMRLYPQPYRDRFGDPMAQTLQDMLDDTEGRGDRIRLLARVALDLPIQLLSQNAQLARDLFVYQTPRYAKRGAVASAVLLAPFFLMLVATAMTPSAIRQRTLFQDSVAVSYVVLPMLALLLVLGTMLIWARAESRAMLVHVCDVRRSWLLSVVGALALVIVLGVPLHDSAHCVIDHPIRAGLHPSRTAACVNSGLFGGDQNR